MVFLENLSLKPSTDGGERGNFPNNYSNMINNMFVEYDNLCRCNNVKHSKVLISKLNINHIWQHRLLKPLFFESTDGGDLHFIYDNFLAILWEFWKFKSKKYSWDDMDIKLWCLLGTVYNMMHNARKWMSESESGERHWERVWQSKQALTAYYWKWFTMND